jgi:hypothetical protein
MIDITDLKGLKFPEKNSDNPPTLICGHGGELCNDDRSLQILDIPENCMLITFADCGLTYGAINIYNAILNNKKNLHYFEDPIKHKDDLERILNRKIHIHHPNTENETSRTYVNTHYRLIGDHIDKEDNCLIQLSGLVPLEKKHVEKIYVTQSQKFKCTKGHSWDMFYSASIYPTKNQVAPIFGRKLANTLPKLVEKIPVVTQKFLFEKRPGIYFNPLCRVNSCDVKHVMNRQYKSSRAINRNLNTDIKYFENIISNCVEYDDCALYNRKYDMMEKLDKSELNKLKKLVVGRAKHFKYEDNENYTPILKYIDQILNDDYNNNNNKNNNVNIISENVDNNNFRTIQLPNRPKKQSFNYNLVKVGSARRRTRKIKHI